MEKLATEAPKFRDELVLRIRQEIHAGTYDSPERLEAAFDQLMTKIGE